jgi:hypothetical protein
MMNVATIQSIRLPLPERQATRVVRSDYWLGGGCRSSSSNVRTQRAATEEHVVDPEPDDVLLGRGKSNQKHPGNIQFRGTCGTMNEECLF